LWLEEAAGLEMKFSARFRKIQGHIQMNISARFRKIQGHIQSPKLRWA
jgi:hypothetical protein